MIYHFFAKQVAAGNNNDAKVGAQSHVLADAEKSIDNNSTKAAGTYGPNTSWSETTCSKQDSL
jgi:hypothetical protein